eukprot:142026-Chlamydomonas_euryale.AAC.1
MLSLPQLSPRLGCTNGTVNGGLEGGLANAFACSGRGLAPRPTCLIVSSSTAEEKHTFTLPHLRTQNAVRGTARGPGGRAVRCALRGAAVIRAAEGRPKPHRSKGPAGRVARAGRAGKPAGVEVWRA